MQISLINMIVLVNIILMLCPCKYNLYMSSKIRFLYGLVNIIFWQITQKPKLCHKFLVEKNKTKYVHWITYEMLLKEAKYHYNSSYWLYNVHVHYTKTKVDSLQKYIGLKLVLKEHSYLQALVLLIKQSQSCTKNGVFFTAQTNCWPYLFWQGFSCFCKKNSPKLKKYEIQIRINFNPMWTISALDHNENLTGKNLKIEKLCRELHRVCITKVRTLWEGHKIWKNLPLNIWRYWVASNFKWKIFSNFVAFSEYLNFKSPLNIGKEINF